MPLSGLQHAQCSMKMQSIVTLTSVAQCTTKIHRDSHRNHFLSSLSCCNESVRQSNNNNRVLAVFRVYFLCAFAVFDRIYSQTEHWNKKIKSKTTTEKGEKKKKETEIVIKENYFNVKCIKTGLFTAATCANLFFSFVHLRCRKIVTNFFSYRERYFQRDVTEWWWGSCAISSNRMKFIHRYICEKWSRWIGMISFTHTQIYYYFAESKR